MARGDKFFEDEHIKWTKVASTASVATIKYKDGQWVSDSAEYPPYKSDPYEPPLISDVVKNAMIIEYSKRPFSSIEEHDETLIANWNHVVRPQDNAYILGDISFHKPKKTAWLLSRLNGNKHAVWGNHDWRNREDEEVLRQFIWAKDLAEIKVSDPAGYKGAQRIVLCHFPLLVWNKSHHGSYSLHGHSHGYLKADPHSLRMDVGVDPNGYTPVSYTKIKEEMATKNWKPIDHHGRD